MDKVKLETFFNKNYKILLLIPLILLALSIIITAKTYTQIGSPIDRDISLKGGITITLSGDFNIDLDDLQKQIESNTNKDVLIREINDFATRKQVGVIVEVEADENIKLEEQSSEIKTLLENYLQTKLDDNNFSVEETSSSLGESFFQQLIFALIIAFIFMAIVVFIAFRSIIPSFAVVFTALTDLIVTVAILNIFEVKISSAGIAAFLLVLGYSIDTDILMTTKILKRRGEGSFFERLTSTFKTGITMTITTIVALTVAYLVTNSFLLKEMFLIIIIALIIDIISTYLGNGPILKWYCKKKGLL